MARLSEKCFFCEYDVGPLKQKPEVCVACCGRDNFRPKKHMMPRMKQAYEALIREEGEIDRLTLETEKTTGFDRVTALAVLKDISACMYPSVEEVWGRKTLVIGRVDFERIRAKYLDNKGEEK